VATGTANLSQTHPVLIAAHAAMFDHLAEGRFILGVSARLTQINVCFNDTSSPR
jgi:alkanesulfonate monooxygenase SsuD/methylene tetrahydromethanopterin reductase-like flavin-dependent oxidoreductase (luciferase family)